jgi:HAMP domain-containing protein
MRSIPPRPPTAVTARLADAGRMSGVRRLDRFAQAVYERFGVVGLFAAVVAGGWTLSSINIAAVTLTFGSYARLGFRQIRGSLVLAEGMGVIGLLIAVVVNHRVIRLGLAWSGDGRRSDRAPVVWRAVVVGPRLVVTAAVSAISLLQAVPIVLACRHFHESGSAAVLMVVLAITTTVANGIFVILAIEFVLRPLTRDVARVLPAIELPEVRTFPLTAKAMLPVPGAILFTGFVVGAHADATKSLGTRLGTSLGVAALVAIPGVVLFMLAMRSALAPVDDLTSAAVAVGKGNLRTEVAVVSTDELGILARRFNDMVVGLNQREMLRSAMGAYLDQTLAERVLSEGSRLPAEAHEVTVMSSTLSASPRGRSTRPPVKWSASSTNSSASSSRSSRREAGTRTSCSAMA